MHEKKTQFLINNCVFFSYLHFTKHTIGYKLGVA